MARKITMTNIEWLQSIGKEKAIEFIGGFCPKHKDGCCKDCPYDDGGVFIDTDFCGAYTLGIDDLGHWLFDEHKNDSERN